MYWLQLIRWKNLTLILISQLLLVFCVSRVFLLDTVIFIINTFLITAAGNIQNDYYDEIADRINKPNHVILGDKISKKKAFVVFVLFNLIALGLNFYMFYASKNLYVFWIVNAIIVLLFLYNKWFKGIALLGNFTVAFLTALPIFIFVLILKVTTFQMQIIVVFSSFSFALNLIREIVKDIKDVKGDKKAGLKTLPILIGVKNTNNIVQFFLVLIVLALTILCYWIPLYLKIYTCFFVIAPLLYTFKRLKNNSQHINFSKISQLLKVVIAFGIISIFLFKLC